MAGFKACLYLFIFVCLGCAHRYWVPNYKVHQDSLDNGLRVIYVEDHKAPVVTYTTLFKVGSAWEKKGKTGLAHFVEHLMFKGTPRFGEKQFFRKLETKGALVNAYTLRDATVYYEVISSRFLELVIDMESDRLKNLKITQEDLDAERKIIKEERRLRVGSNFNAQHVEELEGFAFPNHPYGWPVIGYADDLDQISLKDCQEFIDNYYSPSNAIIVISGDFEHEHTKKLIEKYYGEINERDVPTLDPDDEKLEGKEKRREIFKPVKNESLLVGYYIPSIYSKDTDELTMLGWALFGMDSSRATVRLVREKQIALRVGGTVQSEQFPFLFTISVDMKRGYDAQLAEAEIDSIIEELLQKPLTENELQRVKNWLIFNTVNEIKSPAGFANWLANGLYYWDDSQYVFRVLEQYRQTKPEDLLRVAKKYLKKENRVVVTMKPQPRAYAKKH